MCIIRFDAQCLGGVPGPAGIIEGGASDDHEVRLPGGNNFLCLFRRSDQSDGHGLHARFLTDLGTEGHLIAGRQRNLLTMVEAARGNIDIVAADRSEEHTSELQSLMSISSAVFCLQKKNIEHLNNKNLYHT